MEHLYIMFDRRVAMIFGSTLAAFVLVVTGAAFCTPRLYVYNYIRVPQQDEQQEELLAVS